MCGIAGFVRTTPHNVREDSESLKRMCDIIRHRGPDAEGQQSFDDRVFLGHRRLSIIDLSEDANQPLSNEDGKVTIVYNGEVYNYMDFHDRLESAGHRFKSKGDTETLVHLYEEMGIDMLNKLNGMFAFAMWDARKKMLFCARDAYGVKPFYYTRISDGIAFSSEIKALLTLPEVRADVDRLAYWQNLSFRYVPGERTLFAGIKKLLPGHYLTWRPDGELQIKRWSNRDKAKRRGSESPVSVNEVREVLESAVHRQMVADVPVGSFLSGGLDSSLATAMMCRTSDPMHEVRTYTVGYAKSEMPGRSEVDRLEYVDDLARNYPLQQHIIPPIIDPNEYLNLETLKKIVWHIEEPVVDSALMNAMRISESARATGTPVLLSGHGADEIFGGYRRHRAASHLNVTRRVPDSLLRTAGKLSRKLPGDMYRIGQFLEASSLVPPRDLIRISFPNSPQTALQALAPDFVQNFNEDDVLEYHLGVVAEYDTDDPVDASLYLDQWTYLVDQNLLYMDKLSMAHSIESRVPFLDTELFELAATIPVSQLIQGKKLKAILHDVAQPLVPASILNRPKSGFGVTFLYEWWRTNKSDWYEDLLSSALNRGWYEPGAVKTARANAKKGNTQSSDLLFSVLLSEVWAQCFLDV